MKALARWLRGVAHYWPELFLLVMVLIGLWWGNQ